MYGSDLVFEGCTAGELCCQAGVLAGILRPGEMYSKDGLATCLFHLEGLLQESSRVSKSVLSHELAARIAPAFGLPFPVVSEIAIKAAVAAEQERCAKIADETAEIADSEQKAAIAQWIAERIRWRGGEGLNGTTTI